MSDSGPALACRESRAARRLVRLFRFERNGGFDRRPVATAAQLIARRGALIATLESVDCERRLAAGRSSEELDHAMAELAREIALSRDGIRMRHQQIINDLRLSRGEGLPTGIRNSPNGHPLGKT